MKVKDELAGRSGKCPKCGSKITIPKPQPPKPKPADDGLAPIPFDNLDDDQPPPKIVVAGEKAIGTVEDAAPDQPKPADAQQAGLPKSTAPAAGVVDSEKQHVHVPTHLDILSHYLICDHKDVVGRWESDGRGWLIRLKDGFTRAATVSTHIPQFGKFKLIEVGVERRDDGLHLRNITPYNLQEHYALMKLTKGDDAVLQAVTGIGELNPSQRGHIRALVRQKFLPHIWPEMDQFLDEPDEEA